MHFMDVCEAAEEKQMNELGFTRPTGNFGCSLNTHQQQQGKLNSRNYQLRFFFEIYIPTNKNEDSFNSV